MFKWKIKLGFVIKFEFGKEKKRRKNLAAHQDQEMKSFSRKDRISCRATTSFLRTNRRDHWHSRDERSAAIINHSSPKQRQKTDNRDVDGLRIPTSGGGGGSWTKTLTRGKKVRTVPKNSRPYSRYTERAPPRKEKGTERGAAARERERDGWIWWTCTCEVRRRRGGGRRKKKKYYRRSRDLDRASAFFARARWIRGQKKLENNYFFSRYTFFFLLLSRERDRAGKEYIA